MVIPTTPPRVKFFLGFSVLCPDMDPFNSNMQQSMHAKIASPSGVLKQKLGQQVGYIIIVLITVFNIWY